MLRVLLGGLWWCRELACPHASGAVQLAGLQLRHSVLNGLASQALGLQLLADARRAHAAGAAVEHRFQHTGFVNEVLGLQVIQQGHQVLAVLHMSSQLGHQLGARMFALAEQPQRAAFE
ncbi:hypothetical protein D3C71_1867620 [compost metagenome]